MVFTLAAFVQCSDDDSASPFAATVSISAIDGSISEGDAVNIEFVVALDKPNTTGAAIAVSYSVLHSRT